MDIREVIRSQYLAALGMLEEAIVACPESMWNAAEDKNRFWHVAYHTAFFTHLYLQERNEQFVPWAKHRREAVDLRSDVATIDPYGKEDVLEYLGFCRGMVDEKVPSLDLDAASGFPWLPFGKLELQIYNMRHIQQHTGELMERLGVRAGIDVPWIGSGEKREQS